MGISSAFPNQSKWESLSPEQHEACVLKAYSDLVVQNMRLLKLTYLQSQIESFFPITYEKFKKLKDDISLEIKNDTFGQDSSPFLHLLGRDDASILFDVEDGIQNQLKSCHPDHKLLHDFHVSIAQHLHKSKMTVIPSIMDTTLQWDPQRNIAIRYGVLTGKIINDYEPNTYIPRI